MNVDPNTSVSSKRRRKKWPRLAVKLVVLVVLLGWVTPRLYYFGWVTTVGSMPKRQMDFTRLVAVLPPKDATLAAVYRGLPHQARASGKLFGDLFTTSHRVIGGYRFFTRPIDAPETLRQAVTSAMQAPVLYQPYGGPKLCGGYHPDYCFEWHSPRGVVYGLLCTGCREIILIGGGTEVQCDLNETPWQKLETLLSELP